MIKYFATVFLLLILQLTARTQPNPDYNLIPYRDGKKWGYCDRDGKVVIQPQWDRVNPFGNGKARVFFNDAKGKVTCLIDGKGKYIIPPSVRWNGRYTDHNSEDIWNISDTSGHVGHIDTNGRITIPPIYDDNNAPNLCRNYYRVFKDGKQGVVRKDGKLILPCKYAEVWHTSPCDITPPMFWVSEESTQADMSLVDTNGKALLTYKPAKHPTIQYRDTNNNVYFREDTSYYIWTDYPYGDKKKLPFALQELNSNYGEVMAKGVYVVRVNGKYGFADMHGNILMEPAFDEIFGDTGAVLIGENRLHTGNPDERYEFVNIDKKTLKPVGQPERAAQSGIETYKRKRREKDEFEDQFNVVVYRRNVDQVLFQSDGSVAYRKGRYFVRLLPAVKGHQEYLHYTREGAHLPVAVYDTAEGKFIGFTLADDSLNTARPPQGYFIEDVSRYTPQHYVTLVKDSLYALADTNFNILVDFQPLHIDGRNYFVANGKKYLIVSDVSEMEGYHNRQVTNVLVGADGKSVPGFDQYKQIRIMNNANIYGWPITRLMATNASGKAGIVDLHGKVLYPDISFKYTNISQLGPDLFQVNSPDGAGMQLLNSKGKDYFPGHKILMIQFPTPQYFFSRKNNEDPIPGIYLISLDHNDRYFYINDKGKAFVKDFNF